MSGMSCDFFVCMKLKGVNFMIWSCKGAIVVVFCCIYNFSFALCVSAHENYAKEVKLCRIGIQKMYARHNNKHVFIF